MGDLRKRFGKLVSAHRRGRGMTQQQLAEAADLSDTMIGRIENGATGARFPSIERIAAALQVDPAELFNPGASRKALRGPLMDVTARLSGLSDRELGRIGRLIDIALEPRG